MASGLRVARVLPPNVRITDFSNRTCALPSFLACSGWFFSVLRTFAGGRGQWARHGAGGRPTPGARIIPERRNVPSTLRRYSFQTITETRPLPSVHVRVTTVCRNRSRLGFASRNTGLQRVSHRLGALKVRPPGPVRLDRGPSRLCRSAPCIAAPPPRQKTAGSRTPATNLSALAASAVTARPVARRAALAYGA